MMAFLKFSAVRICREAREHGMTKAPQTIGLQSTQALNEKGGPRPEVVHGEAKNSAVKLAADARGVAKNAS